MDVTAPHPVGGINRRAFLAGGIALAASTSMVGGLVLRNRPNALARLAASSGPKLSIGFVEGASTLAEAHGLTAVPAAAVATGDSSLLAQLVRVRIHGLSPGLAAEDRPDLSALALDALVPSPRDRTGEVLPFYAWNLRRTPVLQASSPATFAATVEHEPTLGFRLGVTGPSPGTATTESAWPATVFTAGRERSQPKMREGLFLVGVDPSAWAERRRVPAADDPGWRGLLSVVLSVRVSG